MLNHLDRQVHAEITRALLPNVNSLSSCTPYRTAGPHLDTLPPLVLTARGVAPVETKSSRVMVSIPICNGASALVLSHFFDNSSRHGTSAPDGAFEFIPSVMEGALMDATAARQSLQERPSAAAQTALISTQFPSHTRLAPRSKRCARASLRGLLIEHSSPTAVPLPAPLLAEPGTTQLYATTPRHTAEPALSVYIPNLPVHGMYIVQLVIP